VDGIEELRRWQDAGGHCRVLGRSGEEATVGLFTCDGGEEMGQVTVALADLAEVDGVDG
jgi:hypothetical protein